MIVPTISREQGRSKFNWQLDKIVLCQFRNVLMFNCYLWNCPAIYVSSLITEIPVFLSRINFFVRFILQVPCSVPMEFWMSFSSLLVQRFLTTFTRLHSGSISTVLYSCYVPLWKSFHSEYSGNIDGQNGDLRKKSSLRSRSIGRSCRHEKTWPQCFVFFFSCVLVPPQNDRQTEAAAREDSCPEKEETNANKNDEA